MPSPFSGMDPYLEHPVLWTGWHQAFTTFVCVGLNAILPPRYIANLNERLYVVEPDQDIYPDVDVRERSFSSPPAKRAAGPSSVALAGDPPLMLAVEAEEVREPFIEIMPVADQGRVIASLELLSPSNKAAGTLGRQQYRAKQRQLLTGPAHVLEIDLLRRGEHTVVAPRDLVLRRAPYDYLVSLSRGGQRDRCQAWPWALRERLPRVLVPLADGDDDVVLHLQPIFDRCYDDCAYARRLDYRGEPTTPLAREDAGWADTLLRERGLRGTRRRTKKKEGRA